MLTRMIGQFEILLSYLVQLRCVHFFQVQQFVPGTTRGTNDLVELYLQCLCIPVLSILDQKDHKESDDRRAGVDYQLPGIGKAEYRPCRGPNQDDRNCSHECGRFAAKDSGISCKSGKV